MGVLVVAEHDHQALAPATLNAVTAAAQMSPEVTVLVAGSGCRPAAEAAARLTPVGHVLLAEAGHLAHPLAEDLAPLAARLAERFSHLVAPASAFGKNLLPRVAALLDVAQVSDAVAVLSPDTFVRPMYAGNVLATVQTREPVILVTVRPTSFDAATADGGAATIETLPAGEPQGLSAYVSSQLSNTGRPDLSAARVVVAGGRGLGSREAFELLERLADRLRGAVGATRAAVDAGYVSNDYQIGQTGKVVAPELYIGAGISGAIQHVAGIAESKVIVAINKDPEAPIFQISDYGLVADLNEALPALLEALEEA